MRTSKYIDLHISAKKNNTNFDKRPLKVEKIIGGRFIVLEGISERFRVIGQIDLVDSAELSVFGGNVFKLFPETFLSSSFQVT